MGVENQQFRGCCSGLIFPVQLPLGDAADIGIAGVALLLIDKVPYVLAYQYATKSAFNGVGQPAFTAGFRSGQHQYFHALTSARSRRQVNQP